MAGFFCPIDGQTFEDKPRAGRCPVHLVLVKPIPDAPDDDDTIDNEDDDTDDTEKETPEPSVRF